ncbi:unnamed protein product [Rotaria sp. Silwood1]
MSSVLFDLILLWSSQESDVEYTELQNLLKTEFPTQFIIHSFITSEQAIKHIESTKNPSRLTIVITKLGTNDENSGQILVETIRRHEKHTFIIIHSHTACNDPNLR